MLAFKFIAAAAVLAQGALSEGVHLFNCYPWGAAGSARIWRSLVAYCADDADCSKLGYVIPAENVCVMSNSGTAGSFHIWEGGPQSCTFPSGVTFGWNLPSNAQSKPNYSAVGSGWNDYRSFTGYKDDKENGASIGGFSCTKIYYFL